MAGRDQSARTSQKMPPPDAFLKQGVRRKPTILVVDGDESFRDIVSLQLRTLGFNSLEAKDAAAALKLLVEGERISLLLADAAPPGMSAAELVETMHALRPGLPFILMSNRVNPAFAGRPDLLRKPFRAEQLKDKIDAALEARAAARQVQADAAPR
jgi:DNA-binding NtrC family response regulator